MEDEVQASVLGEPTFVSIDGGRVRCLETGHEMPESEKQKHSGSKKCREALFDRALAEGRSALKFFEQSPRKRDRIVCKITGALVNKNEKAVWKHVLGKTFHEKLAATEGKEDDEPVLKTASGETPEEQLELDMWMPPDGGEAIELQAMDAAEDDLSSKKQKKKKESIPKSQVMDEDELSRKKQKKKKESNIANEPTGYLLSSKCELVQADELPLMDDVDIGNEVKSKKKKKQRKLKDELPLKMGDESELKAKKIKKKKGMKSVDESSKVIDDAEKPKNKKQNRKNKKEMKDTAPDEEKDDTEDIVRSKRSALAVGPNSFASRKKKPKTN